MAAAVDRSIHELVKYAQLKGWIDETDRIWAVNRVLEVLKRNSYEETFSEEEDEIPSIQTILDKLCADAYARNLIAEDTTACRDLLDTALIGTLVPRPREVINQFWEHYKNSAREATDWYYRFCGDTNYIRRERIIKDLKWTAPTEYGVMDITINLSKPEKDPKSIAAAGKVKSTGYPKCLLCIENEGFAGHLNHPARQNHRPVPIRLNEKTYYLQYSPYVYYNEHCIVFNEQHVPMRIDRNTFANLLDFVTVFPHYFIGSNADLPIVGGSVLSHDHYQGGCYEFPMARAEIEKRLVISGFEDVEAGILYWPMSVIRLRCGEKEQIIELADHILQKWHFYDDPDVYINHETEGNCHNTITPIARRRGQLYEMDLVLRCNITTPEHPLGVFHPHSDKHHIKKENIGLIEAMGLAVLPARLKRELSAVKDHLLKREEMESDPLTADHCEWALRVLRDHAEMTSENAERILQEEVGRYFAQILEDAGVFKRTEQGRKAFERFLSTL